MLIERLLGSFERHHSHQALWVAGRCYSYQKLGAAAGRLSNRLFSLPERLPIGILTARSLAAYAGILGTVLSGRPYLPLNVDYPFERLMRIIESARPSALILSAANRDLGTRLQASASGPLALIIMDNDGDLTIDVEWTVESGPRIDRHAADEADQERPAYMMFTSGTTGEPKGIVVSQANLSAYLTAIDTLFDFHADDRFSQFFNLSFDLSVHDMFVAWTHGACLFVPGKADLMDPVGFAQRHELSVWFSVPSVASLAMRFRKLRSYSLPSLRHGLFCGEALSGEIARVFSKAAPNAALTNLYGPTEATIAITHYRIPPDRDGKDGAKSLPIGRAFPDQETLVLSDDLTPVDPGEIGELWLGGSQLARGYTNNPEQTAIKFQSFAHPERKSTAWYATGDLVQEHPDVGLVYRGRKDDQIKLHGHRIELTEVEEALRRAAGTPLAIVTTWPLHPTAQPEKLIAIIAEPHPPTPDILTAMAAILPPFMIPASITSVAEMAFNANGKLDRKGTVERLNKT